MNSNHFEKLNTLLGGLVFLIAMVAYSLTVEPTVSFWDCGEYIATASNLEVGHPPGAATFQILGAIFSLLNFGNPQYTALAVNLMSAFCSAITIAFLFWIISFLAKKIVGELTQSNAVIIFGSALVGSLAFCFSDTFWFSAVEGEVYAMASCFFALVLWLITKWERAKEEKDSDRWLVLIFLVLGLSYGVHLMVFLAIPTIIYIYYTKASKEITRKQFILANVFAFGAFVLVFKLAFPYTLKFFNSSELFFVNQIGLPFHSGTIIAAIVLVSILFFALKYTKEKGYRLANVFAYCMVFLLLGTTTWLMLTIRANVNTPINENNPDSAVGLLRYYNREQYGEWPVFYGQMYTVHTQNGLALDKNKPYLDGSPKYEMDKKSGKYVIVDDAKNTIPNYDKKHVGLFPRMFQGAPNIIENYKSIAGKPKGIRPSFWQNVDFFIDHQVGYMYVRYLFWNFIGRQNDYQGYRDRINGNWKSGIDLIDNARILPEDAQPEFLKRNKANNKYYFIPLILGIIGLLFHSGKNWTEFYAYLIVFLLTGIGIILYTNVKAFEPRERDYAVVNSFFIFSIWIGLGVLAIYQFITKYLTKISKTPLAVGVTLLFVLSAPVLMAVQNWDDHDRSGRYTARDMAKNYLDCLEKNAILFVHGDNDTFPLWYVQEVEGYRTDVKVINLSLLSTDWYIDQMKRKTYDAPKIPSQLNHSDYVARNLDYGYYVNPKEYFKVNYPDTIPAKSFMNWIQNKSKRTYLQQAENVKIYPSKNIKLPVNKENAIKSGIVDQSDSAKIQESINIFLDGRSLYKNHFVVLDILTNNNWERPIYFSPGGGYDPKTYVYLTDYFELEGIVYKLVPYKVNSKGDQFGFGEVDAIASYERFKKFQWGNINDPSIYLDEQNRNIASNYRLYFSRIIHSLIINDQKEKAIELIDLCFEKFPLDRFEMSTIMGTFVESFYMLEDKEKARELSNKYYNQLVEEFNYYSLLLEYSSKPHRDLDMTIREITNLISVTDNYDQEFGETLKLKFESLANVLKK